MDPDQGGAAVPPDRVDGTEGDGPSRPGVPAPKKAAMASRIDAMLAAGALDDDEVPDDDGVDEAKTGILDPGMIESPTAVRGVPSAGPDDAELPDEVDAVDLSQDDPHADL